MRRGPVTSDLFLETLAVEEERFYFDADARMVPTIEGSRGRVPAPVLAQRLESDRAERHSHGERGLRPADVDIRPRTEDGTTRFAAPEACPDCRAPIRRAPFTGTPYGCVCDLADETPVFPIRRYPSLAEHLQERRLRLDDGAIRMCPDGEDCARNGACRRCPRDLND